MTLQQQTAYTFTNLTLSHIPRILHMENEAYPEPWNYNMMRQELDNPNSFFSLMYSGEDLIGYGGFWMLVDEAHLTRVTIASPWRGRGLSRFLMEHLIRKATRRGASCVRLEVRENNTPARRLYTGLGFSTEGKRIGYYQRTNENAIVMALPIGSSSDSE